MSIDVGGRVDHQGEERCCVDQNVSPVTQFLQNFWFEILNSLTGSGPRGRYNKL